jgi:acyl-CoA hydrolase
MKLVSESEVKYTELMIPSYSNFGGKVHGGVILSIMDKVAYVCASKHSGSYVVTVSVEGVEFLSPVEVGDLLTVEATINYVGKSSMIVGMKLESFNPITACTKHTSSCFFTMVAKNSDGSVKEVPGLIIKNKEELIRFCEGKWMKSASKLKKQMLDSDLNGITLNEMEEMCKLEKCTINL